MINKSNFFTDNTDIQFQINHRVDFTDLFSWLSAEEREAMAVESGEDLKKLCLEGLEALGDICGTAIAPNAKKVEKEELKLVDGEVIFPPTITNNIKTMLDFGIHSLGSPAKFGGMGFPYLLQLAGMETIVRACPSTSMNLVWYSSIAHIVELFGSDAIKEKVIPKISQGEWSGCMALTEADAGSDLQAIRTYGEKQADGSWRLNGSKRFISNGSGQVALVLGMNKKGATGLENLNLYLCLRKIDGKDNYQVTKLEDKVAMHGSATCELNFDNSVAYLLGQENQGFKHMLVLMNDARVATGFQALGMMEASWRAANVYALERKTWGKPIAQHELIAEKLLDMDVEIKALRSLCYQAGYATTMAHLGERRLHDRSLNDSERKDLAARVAKYKRQLRRWTPLVKWYAGEKSFEHARTGLQIHGGYGFSTEYRAEFWLRESLILSLYEGTSQIQALMCLKDTIKDVIKAPRRFVERLFALRVKSLREANPLRKKIYQAKLTADMAVVAILFKLVRSSARATLAELKPQDILRVLKLLKTEFSKQDKLAIAMLHAERLCEIKALVALAESVVLDAKVDSSRSWVAQRFLARAMPRLSMLRAEIEMDEPIILERLGVSREKSVSTKAHDTLEQSSKMH